VPYVRAWPPRLRVRFYGPVRPARPAPAPVEREERDQLPGGVGGGEAGDVGVVVGGGDLHDVASDDVQPRQAAEGAEELAGRQPGDLRGAGGRGVRRVQDVDVDGHVDGPRPQALPDLRDDVADAAFLEGLAVDDLEPGPAVVGQFARVVDAAAHADVLAVVQVEEPLLGRAAEGRAVPDA